MADMTGRALRSLRKKHGLSVAKAAALVHVSHRTWVRWEAEARGTVPETAAHLFRRLLAARALRDAILAIPDRFAVELALERDPVRIRAWIEKQVLGALILLTAERRPATK